MYLLCQWWTLSNCLGGGKKTADNSTTIMEFYSFFFSFFFFPETEKTGHTQKLYGAVGRRIRRSQYWLATRLTWPVWWRKKKLPDHRGHVALFSFRELKRTLYIIVWFTVDRQGTQKRLKYMCIAFARLYTYKIYIKVYNMCIPNANLSYGYRRTAPRD